MIKLAKKVYGWTVNFFQSFISMISVLLFSSFKCNKRICIIANRKSNEECVVLGNGPSLKKCLDNHIDVLEKKDLIVVNNFCYSSFFKVLKPKFYILTDGNFFTNELSEYTSDLQMRFKEAMSSVDWDMILFIPYNKRKSNFCSELSKSVSISVVFYNYTPIEGFKGIEYFLYNHNLGMPCPMNVTNAAAFVMTNMKYKTIYMLGIDHSWLPEIRVNDNNEVSWSEAHFYGPSQAKPKDPLYMALDCMSTMFKSHMRINEYASFKGVKIYNSTPGSFVDAYERKYLYTD